MSFTIAEIAGLLGLPFHGDGARIVDKVSGWESADESSLVFLADRNRTLPNGLKAACLLVPRAWAPAGWNVLFSENPKLDFARAAVFLHPRPAGTGVIHPSAVVSPDAVIGHEVDIGPFVTVEAGAQIDNRCILKAGVVIGAGCRIGRECILHPHVVLYPGVRLGNRVTLHAGVTIGSDGFGYVFDGGNQIKFPQVGNIIIEDDVEIGAQTALDRGSLGVTRIGRGTKIDNLVQIAHNVQIGQGVVIAAQTGISGSTVIEDYAVIGGQVGFGDHARVQGGVVIGSKAGILPGKVVRSGEVYWGVPVRPLREYKRLNALFGRLPEMKHDIDLLKKAVSTLREELAGRREEDD